VVNERHNTALSYIIERSRASEWSDQAMKDDFHRSNFLIPVANASTGDVYVTTPCSSCMMACMHAVCTIPLHGWIIVPSTAAVSLKINLLGYKGVRPNPLEPPLATGLHNADTCTWKIIQRLCQTCIFHSCCLEFTFEWILQVELRSKAIETPSLLPSITLTSNVCYWWATINNNDVKCWGFMKVLVLPANFCGPNYNTVTWL